MEITAGFDWRRLGRPDYSIAAGIIASLPPAIRNDLNASEKGVLTSIVHLAWTYASRSGRGHAYCIPSQAYLARAIARSTRTVRRAIDALAEMGLLEVQRRSSHTGHWLSNLYRLGKRLLAVVYASREKKVQQNRDRTKVSDYDLKKGIEAATPPAAASIDRKKEEVAPASPSVSPALRQETDAAPRWTQEQYDAAVAAIATRNQQQNQPVKEEEVEARRARLKRQAQSLQARGL